jgi:hypothetical protein
MRRLFILALVTAVSWSQAGGEASASRPRAGGAVARSRAHATRGRPRARAKVPRIAAANVLESMYFKERAESDISPAALAAYGNALVARRGLDHMFDACAILRADKRPRPVPGAAEGAKAFAYALRRVGGGRVNFQFVTDLVDEAAGATCGECVFAVPALRVTGREMLVVAGGRRYRLERPAGFLLDRASLVDDSLKQNLRTWQLPYQASPLGLSADRAKLYLPLPDFGGEQWDDQLAVEISDAGVRFVARAGLNLPEGEVLTISPPDAGDAHLEFRRFGTGAQSYVLRLGGSCT